jgi:hypothetical protein
VTSKSFNGSRKKGKNIETHGVIHRFDHRDSNLTLQKGWSRRQGG